MKKVITLSSILLCSLCLAACNTTKNTSAEKTETTSVQETTVATTTAPIKDTQWIGSDDYGYVKVPQSWIKFKDVNGGDDIQYSDGTDINIVTLNTFKAEQFGISESELEKVDPIQISNSIYQSKSESPDFSKVWGSKSRIGGYDAYQVNCIAKTGKYLVIWIFKSDDGKFRYVSLEGDLDTIKELAPTIEESWTNKKP
ncbi:hypothetical protein [Streptococcus sp. Marseille-Q3533]|jgi:hypothetical protein|uniref:hypothetical protein n=1 Tax=Streptococcus TaxID=1301 RepID=UPI002025AC23|nr:hypothetical protein [Streptococcus sp. Marseille-Q3533]